METCPICRSELAPEWKFCVHCGTPIVHVDRAAAPAEPIPSAIRPEPVAAPSHGGLNGQVVFGMAMGSLGLTVVIYALVSILGSRG